jgi:hypothetical protein
MGGIQARTPDRTRKAIATGRRRPGSPCAARSFRHGRRRNRHASSRSVRNIGIEVPSGLMGRGKHREARSIILGEAIVAARLNRKRWITNFSSAAITRSCETTKPEMRSFPRSRACGCRGSGRSTPDEFGNEIYDPHGTLTARIAVSRDGLLNNLMTLVRRRQRLRPTVVLGPPTLDQHLLHEPIDRRGHGRHGHVQITGDIAHAAARIYVDVSQRLDIQGVERILGGQRRLQRS